MARRPPKQPGLAAFVAALPAAERTGADSAGWPWPGGTREFTDDHGYRWHRRAKAALDPRRAARLVRDADVMITGPWELRHLAPGERAAAWAEATARTEPGDLTEYVAHEFTSEGGLTLLYLERHC
ncbi:MULTISPECIES: hypothetical protein [Kitasatospora]|uniref:Uncharacterized protein n=1 Tax=Kitasatospora setae (strain ATCC 33774 / DSM 43861 / JCM 3304 / KCC A-0304 / NBRC 14216 / KM-6054) TaxID=452652 RepID=E4N458_KITSK|nr:MULTISPECIES: hypothetical protein [Kitasatospora]BAJ25989.1 hypothetical protein KSE_01380 [Kitasatospora setae KM-6054]